MEKSTYSAGDSMPEISEDISDLVSIISPHETPLLDRARRGGTRPARSTVHEWLEDALLNSNTDTGHFESTDAELGVANAEARFRVGDQLKLAAHP